jgi:hypothetical protein
MKSTRQIAGLRLKKRTYILATVIIKILETIKSKHKNLLIKDGAASAARLDSADDNKLETTGDLVKMI